MTPVDRAGRSTVGVPTPTPVLERDDRAAPLDDRDASGRRPRPRRPARGTPRRSRWCWSTRGLVSRPRSRARPRSRRRRRPAGPRTPCRRGRRPGRRWTSRCRCAEPAVDANSGASPSCPAPLTCGGAAGTRPGSAGTWSGPVGCSPRRRGCLTVTLLASGGSGATSSGRPLVSGLGRVASREHQNVRRVVGGDGVGVQPGVAGLVLPVEEAGAVERCRAGGHGGQQRGVAGRLRDVGPERAVRVGAAGAARVGRPCSQPRRAGRRAGRGMASGPRCRRRPRCAVVSHFSSKNRGPCPPNVSPIRPMFWISRSASPMLSIEAQPIRLLPW